MNNPRPVDIEAATIRVACQTCKSVIDSPDGSPVWTVAQYSDFAERKKSRATCSKCGARLRLVRSFLATVSRFTNSGG